MDELKLIDNIVDYIREVKAQLHNNIININYQSLPYIEAKAQIEAYNNLQNYINFLVNNSQNSTK